jgi:hypothetical protein
MLSVRKYTGARSVRDYAASLGTDPKTTEQLSLRRLVGADVLHRNWQARGADVRVGPPVADVAFAGGRFSRQYSGGRLSVAAGGEEVLAEEAYEAVVYLAGIECIRRGKDQLGDPDNEVYLIVTPIDGNDIVVGGPKATVNAISTDTYNGVNGGDWIGIGQPIWRGRDPASLTLQLVLWERDAGNKKEAREAVEKAVRDTASIVALGVGLATGNPTAFLNQLPQVDKLAKAVAPFIRDIFGLDDDRIGSGYKHLNYNELRGAPPPVNEPTKEIPAKTRGLPVAIGKGPDTGEWKIHFFWETRQIPPFE